MSGPRQITDLSEVREFTAYCHEGAESYEELHSRLSEFEIAIDLSQFQNLDPFSQTYADRQLEFYERLTGEPYSLENEANEVQVEISRYDPFPFGTKSKAAVGQHMAAVGKLIQEMPVDPPAKVLDMGPGWGNTTIALAQTGYDVTALDIESRFIDLIDLRAQDARVAVNTRVGSFDDAHTLGQRFDCVLFYESFHHSLTHYDLLADLIHNVLTEDGYLYFVAESFDDNYPIPWGLRMDPMSLYSICQFGWFELGFSTDYFHEALHRLGFVYDRNKYSELIDADQFIAYRGQPRSIYEPNEHFKSRDNAAFWQRSEPNSDFRFTKGSAELRLHPPTGTSKANFRISNLSPLDKQVIIKTDIATKGIDLKVGDSQEVVIELTERCETLSIETEPWNPKRLGISADDRELGVAVHRVQLS